MCNAYQEKRKNQSNERNRTTQSGKENDTRIKRKLQANRNIRSWHRQAEMKNKTGSP